MNLDAMKRAIKTAQAKRETFRTPTLANIRKAVRTGKRSIQDDKEIFRIKRQIDSERAALIDMINENLRLKAEIDGLPLKTYRLVQEIAGDHRQLKKRRTKAAKRNAVPRGKAGDEVDWSKYDVCRAIDNHLSKARKEGRRLTQVQAAQRVIDNYNTEYDRIKCSAKSLCVYYRDFKASKKKAN